MPSMGYPGGLTILEPSPGLPRLTGIKPGWVTGALGVSMTRLISVIVATLVAGSVALPSSAFAADAKQLRCTATVTQYTETLKALEAGAAQARALAERNPLYESDVAYYASVLADTQQCIKQLDAR